MIKNKFIMHAVEKNFIQYKQKLGHIILTNPSKSSYMLMATLLNPLPYFWNTQKITEYHSWTTSPRETFYNLYHYNTNSCKTWIHSLDPLVLVLHRFDCTGSHCFILQHLEDYPCWTLSDMYTTQNSPKVKTFNIIAWSFDSNRKMQRVTLENRIIKYGDR